MPGTIDDRRAASNIAASLSSYLITAVLAVIAAEAVIVTFAFDKREHLVWFDLFSAIALAASIASIYFGGRGIGELTRRGLDGDWVVRTSKGHFDKQAKLGLLGVLLVSISVFFGKAKVEKPTSAQEVEMLKTSVRELRESLKDMDSRYQSVSAQLNSLLVSIKTPSAQHAKKRQKN